MKKKKILKLVLSVICISGCQKEDKTKQSVIELFKETLDHVTLQNLDNEKTLEVSLQLILLMSKVTNIICH
ncbi:MAG: hypothetical protein LBU51_09625 [Bacteroidales bacterium]|jgi:PBP1b-binding outer membrane lipoprotein LpoB|nr:hypothetical protein [Bacteroidales bacterium]